MPAPPRPFAQYDPKANPYGDPAGGNMPADPTVGPTMPDFGGQKPQTGVAPVQTVPNQGASGPTSSSAVPANSPLAYQQNRPGWSRQAGDLGWQPSSQGRWGWGRQPREMLPYQQQQQGSQPPTGVTLPPPEPMPYPAPGNEPTMPEWTGLKPGGW